MAVKEPVTRAGVEVRLEELRRSYAGVQALNGVSLTLAPGELVALLGPSGCGKTTAMRLVAGLEEADGGRVVIAGADVTNLPASKRDVGMVFQAYSLFPHMTALQNVAFGLQMRHVALDERRRRAAEMLEVVGLGGLGDRVSRWREPSRSIPRSCCSTSPCPRCTRGSGRACESRFVASSSRPESPRCS